MIPISEWYVIRTASGNEETVRELLQAEGITVKIIYREMYYKRQGKIVSMTKKLFPGYIFAITDMDYNEFDKLIFKVRYTNSQYFFNLKQDREGTPALTEKEKHYLSRLVGEGDVIQNSVGYIEGDKVIVTDGPLMGYESYIVYIDRHKRIAKIDINFLGEKRTITVPLEIIAKR